MRLSLLAASALCVLSLAAHADSLTLDTATSSNGTFNYTYNQTAISEFYSYRSHFVISGLSGVTGASTSYPNLYTVTFTGTSATFTVSNDIVITVPTLTDLFSITSSVTTLGTAQYSLPASSMTSSSTGSLQGPVTATVAVTPEPSSFALLGTGLLGVAGVIRKRLA